MNDADEFTRETVGWQRLRERAIAQDRHRCRNCTSDKYLEVHHRFAGPEVKKPETSPNSAGDPTIVLALGIISRRVVRRGFELVLFWVVERDREETQAPLVTCIVNLVDLALF